MTEEEAEMAYATKMFQKIMKRHGGFQKKGSTSRTVTTNDLCHKCSKPGHFMRDFPNQKQESSETIHRKKDLVPDNFCRKAHDDQLVKCMGR